MAPPCGESSTLSVPLRSTKNKIARNTSVRSHGKIGAKSASKNAKKRPRPIAAIASTCNTGAQVECSTVKKWSRPAYPVTCSFDTSEPVKLVTSSSYSHPAMAGDESSVSDPGSPSSQTSQDSGGEPSATSLPSSGITTRLPSPDAPEIVGNSTIASTNSLGRMNSFEDEQCAQWLVDLSNDLPMRKPPSPCPQVTPVFHTVSMTAPLCFPSLVDFGTQEILSTSQSHVASCQQQKKSTNFVYGISTPLGSVVTAAPSAASTEFGVRKGPSGRVMRDIPDGKAPPGWIPCGKHSDLAHGGTGERCIKWAIDNPQGRKMLKFHQKNDLGHASAKCQHCNTIKSLKNLRKHELRCVRSPSRTT